MRHNRKTFQRQSSGRIFLQGLMLLCLSLIPTTLYAQKHTVKFEHLSVEQGLSDGVITGILQDSIGFLWIGTEDGLNRYDGYTVTRYKHHPNNPYSVGANMILTFFEDHHGELWVATTAGLQQYDRAADRFHPLVVLPGSSEESERQEITALYEDRSERFWIGTDAGVYRYGRNARQIVRAVSFAGFPKEIADLGIRTMLEDHHGALWFGTDDGLYQHDGHVVTRFEHDPNDPGSLGHNTVNILYEDRAGNVWLGCDDGGLQRFNRETGTFRHFRHSPNSPESLSHDQVNAIYEDRAGTLWVGTLNGLNTFSPSTEEISNYFTDPTNPLSLSYNEITTIFEDRSGVLWVGTEGGGVNKFNRLSKPFLHYQNNPYNPQSLSHNRVWALLQDHSGTLWVGTEVGGLNQLDRKTGRFTHYRHDPAEPNSLSSDEVTALYEDRTGTLWVGTDGGGLNRFDRTTGTFNSYLPEPGNPFSLSSDKMVSLYEDRAGRFWIGTDGGGLNRFDRDTGQFTHYQHIPDVPTSLSDDSVWAITEDQTGKLWIGTNHGLNTLDPVTGRFFHYHADPTRPNALSHNTVWSITEDSAGHLWIGTDDGLNRLNPREHTFTHYREDKGLPNNRIYGILKEDASSGDTSGRLWLSTAQGLCRFAPETEAVKIYGMNELQNIMFNRGASYKSRSGELFFGGMNGFNAFYPQAITENSHIPSIVLTDFQLFNSSVPAERWKNAQSITLSYKETVLSFEFAALDYTLPNENQYAYMMEGFDQTWNNVGIRHMATYTNLPPGSYVFRVKGTNNDDVWNDEGVAVRILITPPFWQTGWFRLAAAFLIAGSVLGVYHLRVRTIQRQNRRLEIQVQERTTELQQKNVELHDLNAGKDKFFSIISHDLRSPFNALLGYTQLLSEDFHAYTEEEVLAQVDKIRVSARRLYALLENLLTWSRVQRGAMEFEPEDFEIQDIIEYNLDLFTSNAEHKQITLNNMVQEEMMVHADYNMLNTVVRNLLSNALKFTPAGGAITLAAKDEAQWLEVAVSDTGTGIKAEDLEKLFRIDVQYTHAGTNGEKGTGLGLILCQDLVQRNGGAIRVESKIGAGTTFRFTVPKHAH